MRRLAQVDVLKALAIIGVIVNHWMTPEQRLDGFAALHVMEAVPVFFLLMAFNAKGSLDRRWESASAWQIYRGGYVGGRLRRLLPPLVLAATVAAGVASLRGTPALYVGAQNLLLRLPVAFPGNFFVSVSLAFAVLVPLLYVAYRRLPRATVIGCILLSLVFELFEPLKFSTDLYYVYQVNPLRFVALFGLGFWLADGAHPLARRNRFVVPAGLIGAALLVAYIQGLRIPSVGPEYMYHVMSFGWPVLLASAGLTWLPSSTSGVVMTALGHVGEASYHIFLVQGLWFGGVLVGVDKGDYGWLALSLAVCCGVGLAWYRLSRTLRARPGGLLDHKGVD